MRRHPQSPATHGDRDLGLGATFAELFHVPGDSRSDDADALLGRRRYVPAINSPRFNERSGAERIAMNMPIQGGQADMIKRAMVAIHAELRHREL